MSQKNIDKHYEYISRLYLRLKGFISSNLIIHSEVFGNSASEVDIIGFRFPFHSQEDRQVNIVDYLDCSKNRIEIIIADVKNTTNIENVKFNDGLRKNKESIKKLINWIGCFQKVDDSFIDKFQNYLKVHERTDINGFAEFQENTSFGNINFKFTFFCPSLEKWNDKGFKYIDSEELFGFILECLNQTIKIDTCSRHYNYSIWNEFETYIRFFKEQTTVVTKEIFEREFNKK